MKNNIQRNDKIIGWAFVLLICMSLCSIIFYRSALEHIRYALIFCISATLSTNKDILNKLVKNTSFRFLFAFLSISCIGLLINSHKIKYIDEILNWMIIFASGYIASFHLKESRAKMLILLPVVLLTAYIVVPILTGDGFNYINPFNQRRLHIFFAQRANHLGLISGISTLISLHFALRKSLFSDKLFYSFLTAASLIIHISTGSRTVFVATLFICGIWILWHFRKSTKSILFISGTVVFATLLITHFDALGNNRLSRLGLSIKEDKSFQQRMLTWTIATDTIKAKPWFGEGFDTFEIQFKAGRKHYASLPDFKERFPHTSGNTNNAHNFSLHFLSETGVIGLAIITFFWFNLAYKGLRAAKDTSAVVSGALILSYLSFQLNMGLYGSQLSTLIFTLAGMSSYEIDEIKQ